MSKITQEQYLRIQIRNARYKLEIQKKQTLKISELLKTNTKATDIMKSFMESKKAWKAFNLMIEMNDTIHLETDTMEKCDMISQEHFDTLHRTVAQLTSKDGKVGDPRTPEMAEFQMLMNSHQQMHSKSNDKHYDKYATNKCDKRPTNCK